MNVIRNTIILSCILFLGGCYPDSEIIPHETDTVYTNYASNINFSDYKYYSLIDTVFRMYDDAFERPGPYDQLILDKVDSNMQARGFTKVEEGDLTETDVYIIVSDLSFSSVSNYWNSMPYWSNIAHWNVDDGVPNNIIMRPQSNILIDLFEEVESPEQYTMRVYWRGLTSGVYDSHMDDRMKRNIDQMFFQSPYLNNNK